MQEKWAVWSRPSPQALFDANRAKQINKLVFMTHVHRRVGCSAHGNFLGRPYHALGFPTILQVTSEPDLRRMQFVVLGAL